MEAFDQLSGSELTSFLLAEMRRRSRRVDASSALRRLEHDRFTRTAAADPGAIRRVVSELARALPSETDELQLAPLVPFGTHAAVAGVDQNRLVTTIRGTELAADPTVVLAMEAARRRSQLIRNDPKNAELVSVAASQRVTRAQVFAGERSFAHFELAGLVTAGRDTGNAAFERRALHLHIGHIATGLLALGCEGVVIKVSDFTGGRLGPVVGDLVDEWEHTAVSIVSFPERTRARSYYTDLAIEVHVEVGGDVIEVGDGGAVDWSQRLVASRKERMMTSGLGVERLALVLG